MFISEKEALDRLKSNNNLINRLNISVDPEPEPEPEQEQEPTPSTENDPVRAAILAGRRATGGNGRGRYPGQKSNPPALRSVIGAAAKMTSVKEAAKMFGVAPMTAHHYSNGRTGQTAPTDQSLLNSIERDTQGIRQQVLGVLAFTIAGITPDKIENKDAKELSIIARNLGSIMSATKPAADFGDKTTNAQVIVFSPEQEQETFYPTKEIG